MTSNPARAAEQPTNEIDTKAFREAMSRLGAAVHVVTTAGPAGTGGVTMTAVASVTDVPPTLLICLHRQSSLNEILKLNGVFCVSTLPAGAVHLADAFAGRTGHEQHERFGLGAWSAIASGAPALETARVAIDCRVTQVSEVGTHSVIFGAVIGLRFGEAGGALVYLDRGYHAL